MIDFITLLAVCIVGLCEPIYYLLGIKIALGSLAIFGGFYFLSQATKQSNERKVGRAFLLYPFIGLLGVALGGLMIAQLLLG